MRPGGATPPKFPERRITADPWPQLASHLDDAARAGADIKTLLAEAMERGGALPDELPAAALWWRLAGSLSPPPWTPPTHGCAPTGHPNCIESSAAESPKQSLPTRPGRHWSPQRQRLAARRPSRSRGRAHARPRRRRRRPPRPDLPDARLPRRTAHPGEPPARSATCPILAQSPANRPASPVSI